MKTYLGPFGIYSNYIFTSFSFRRPHHSLGELPPLLPSLGAKLSAAAPAGTRPSNCRSASPYTESRDSGVVRIRSPAANPADHLKSRKPPGVVPTTSLNWMDSRKQEAAAVAAAAHLKAAEEDYRRRTPDSRVPSSSGGPPPAAARSPLVNTPGNVPPYMLPYAAAAGGLLPPFSLYSAASTSQPASSAPLSTTSNSHLYRGAAAGANISPEVSYYHNLCFPTSGQTIFTCYLISTQFQNEKGINNIVNSVQSGLCGIRMVLAGPD